jgi:ligand-binding sensor domain-containing protein
MKYIFSILALFIICSYSIAQSYYFKNLSRIDGLSNDYVTDIAQDRQGFVWIATQSGLSRFDGRNFTSYTTLNSDLHNSAINKLFYDEEENKLWIGTNEHLSVLDCSTMKFENFTHLDGFSLQNIRHLTFGSNNDIWIINFQRDVICYNKETKKAVRYASDKIKGFNGHNYCCYDDRKGNLYLGHIGNGLTIFNLDDYRMQNYYHNATDPNSLPGNAVYVIKEDLHGNLWMGTDLR